MIIPTILEPHFDTVKQIVEQIDTIDPELLIQIDIVEPEVYKGKTFLDVTKIESIDTSAKFELDLMVRDPLMYLNNPIKNVTRVCALIDHMQDIHSFINRAKKLGYQVGLSIGPDTNNSAINEYLNQIDYVQILGVTPGGQGRLQIPETISKARLFRLIHPHIRIQVDGGVNKTNIKKLQQAGVNDFVVGSAIIKSLNPREKYVELKDMVNPTNKDQGASFSIAADRKIQKVAILGGAAWQENYQVYKDAFEVSKSLAQAGYEIVNGGGPGVMRASTKGGHAGGGRVLAITYHPNKPKRHYEGVDIDNDFDDEVITLDYFDRTKVMLQTTQAHIVFEGSLGTLSEFGMTWISSWIHHPNSKPIVLYGAFWNDYLAMIDKYSLVGHEEKGLIKVCTTPQEVVDYLRTFEDKK